MSKDTSELKDFPIQYNARLARSLLKGLETLDKKIKSNIVPDQLPDYPQNWQCQYCQFRDICSMVSKGEVKWDDFKKKIEKSSGKQFV